MGCDIHAAFQAKKDGQWVDIESKYSEDRHYFLFSWLAGVRNGYGFAGVPTYTPVKPIAERRGLPADFVCQDEDHPVASLELMGRRAEWLGEGETPHIWMGDHSHSWLTADEILSAEKPDRTWKTGIVKRELFDAWDGKSEPESHCGGITGGAIVIAETPIEVDEFTTHVRVFWKTSGEVLNYFTDEIKRLKDLHGEVRMVFGFDS